MVLVTFSRFNTSIYGFQYNDKAYKQLHGTPVGSPVSVIFVVAGTLIQNIPGRVIISFVPHVTLPRGARVIKGLRYVFTLWFSDDHLHAQKTDTH